MRSCLIGEDDQRLRLLVLEFEVEDLAVGSVSMKASLSKHSCWYLYFRLKINTKNDESNSLNFLKYLQFLQMEQSRAVDSGQKWHNPNLKNDTLNPQFVTYIEVNLLQRNFLFSRATKVLFMFSNYNIVQIKLHTLYQDVHFKRHCRKHSCSYLISPY